MPSIKPQVPQPRGSTQPLSSHPDVGVRAAGEICQAHGGGKRCQQEGCTKSAQASTSFCMAHGGGRRCQVEGCGKVAVRLAFCASHGGKRQCNVAGCKHNPVGKTQMCRAHGWSKPGDPATQ